MASGLVTMADDDRLTPLFAGMSTAALVVGVSLLVLLIVSRRAPKVRSMLETHVAPYRSYVMWMAWLVAAVCMGGSLYYSDVVGYPPCIHCWEQRIAMYPLVGVLAVAGLLQQRGIVWAALPQTVVGLWIAVDHYLLQLNPPDIDTCGSISCSEPYLDFIWGYVTIPFMAMSGFVFILALLATWMLLPEPAVDVVVVGHVGGTVTGAADADE